MILTAFLAAKKLDLTRNTAGKSATALTVGTIVNQKCPREMSAREPVGETSEHNRSRRRLGIISQNSYGGFTIASVNSLSYSRSHLGLLIYDGA